MHAPILPRDDDTQSMLFEGRRVVLLHSEAGTYREWEVQIGGTPYCIVDEHGDWFLLVQGADKSWCDAEGDVDAFLATHRLILAD